MSQHGPRDLTNPEFWDDWYETGSQKTAQKAAGTLKENDWSIGRSGTFIRMVTRHLGSIENQRLLEVGGGGPNLRLLAIRKWLRPHITVLDYSPHGIALVEKSFEAHGETLDTIEDDFFTIDLSENPFDIVLHWGVLEHFDDPAPFLQACSRALKPGGRMLFGMPNMLAWGAQFWKRWSPENWSVHILHEDQDVISCAEEAGLELVSAFHCGTPLFRITPWEKKGPAQFTLTVAQAGIRRLTRIAPVIDRLQSPRFSAERVFLFEKR